MLSESKIAFKEWAVVVNALAQGKQSIILRKGGIQEKNNEFKAEHEEFFLFPTYEHQERADLKPVFHSDLDWIIRNHAEENTVPIRYYAHAEKIFRISDKDLLPKISPFHIWSDNEIEKRFNYGKEEGICLILVRVFELLFPHVVSVSPKYAGCKSWVELEKPLAVRDPIPRISDLSFEAIQDQIIRILQ